MIVAKVRERERERERDRGENNFGSFTVIFPERKRCFNRNVFTLNFI